MLEINGNKYKLIFLDTNVLREISLNNYRTAKIFLEKYIIMDDNVVFVPCFSIYNIVELRPTEDIYEKFKEFFSLVPCIIFLGHECILREEANLTLRGERLSISERISIGASYQGSNFSKLVDQIFSDTAILENINNFIYDLSIESSEWTDQRIKVLQSRNGNAINNKHYFQNEEKTIRKDLNNFDIDLSGLENIKKLYGARIMLYSQFQRVHCTNKKIKPNDVMDVQMSCVIPYVDAVITENYQAEIYKQAKSFIPLLKNVEIYTLKDIKEVIQ